MLIGLIISIALAVTFLCLYVCAAQDKASLNKDNEWLRKQRDESSKAPAVTQTTEPVVTKAVEDTDKRIMDKDAVMEAVRANGYAPVDEDDYVSFIRGDYKFAIIVDRFPFVAVACGFNVEKKDWNFNAVKKAARNVTERYMLGKVLFEEHSDDDNDLIFQVSAIEKQYGHFRNSLENYIGVISDIENSFRKEYNELEEKGVAAAPDSDIHLPEYAQKWEA